MAPMLSLISRSVQNGATLLALILLSLALAESLQALERRPSAVLAPDTAAAPQNERSETGTPMSVVAEIAPQPEGHIYVIKSASQILGATVVENGDELGTITDLLFDASQRIESVTVESWGADQVLRVIAISQLAFREVPYLEDQSDPPPLATGTDPADAGSL